MVRVSTGSAFDISSGDGVGAEVRVTIGVVDGDTVSDCVLFR